MQRSVRTIEAYFDLPKRAKQLQRCALVSELDTTVTLTTSGDNQLNLLYVSVTSATQMLEVNSLVIEATTTSMAA